MFPMMRYINQINGTKEGTYIMALTGFQKLAADAKKIQEAEAKKHAKN
jgi:hypothetical protein